MMRVGAILLVALLAAGCGTPHLKSKAELAREHAAAVKQQESEAAAAKRQQQIKAKQKAAEERQKAAVARQHAIDAYRASEEFRVHKRCVGHGGIQQLMPEVTYGGEDPGTSAILVVCKDGAGPFQELTDSYNAAG